jgi:hypothetical protein
MNVGYASTRLSNSSRGSGDTIGTLNLGYPNKAKTSLQPSDRLTCTSLAPLETVHGSNLRMVARLRPHSSDLTDGTLPCDSPDQGHHHKFKACQKTMSSLPLAPSTPRVGQWVMVRQDRCKPSSGAPWSIQTQEVS